MLLLDQSDKDCFSSHSFKRWGSYQIRHSSKHTVFQHFSGSALRCWRLNPSLPPLNLFLATVAANNIFLKIFKRRMLHNMATLLCFVALPHLVWAQLVSVRQKYQMRGPLTWHEAQQCFSVRTPTFKQTRVRVFHAWNWTKSDITFMTSELQTKVHTALMLPPCKNCAQA